MAWALSAVRPPRRCSSVPTATRRVRSVASERESSGTRLTVPTSTKQRAATTPTKIAT